MSLLAIILIALGIVLVVCFVGGLVVIGRRRRAVEARLHEEVVAADAALARARAEDRGWERSTIEEAARAAVAARHPGAALEDLRLVQVVDRPGTDSDLAVFRVRTGGRSETVTLGRREGAWVDVSAR